MSKLIVCLLVTVFCFGLFSEIVDASNGCLGCNDAGSLGKDLVVGAPAEIATRIKITLFRKDIGHLTFYQSDQVPEPKPDYLADLVVTHAVSEVAGRVSGTIRVF